MDSANTGIGILEQLRNIPQTVRYSSLQISQADLNRWADDSVTSPTEFVHTIAAATDTAQTVRLSPHQVGGTRSYELWNGELMNIVSEKEGLGAYLKSIRWDS